MKYVIALCLFGLAYAANPICQLQPETGPCKAFIPRYYFDSEANECREFIYGGCQGNENRFASQEKCEETCGVQRSNEAICHLEPESGMCLAYMPRYYYNAKEGKCLRFIYGGCQGNPNNFHTLEECEATCATIQKASVPVCEQEVRPGKCLAYMPRYYYDKTSGQCKRFIYGGCDGNENNFYTKEECENACGVVEEAESVCELEAETGPCLAYFVRYYFNKNSGKCEKFVYGGCQGNANNFKSEEACQQTCSAKSAVNVCEQKRETGPCRAYFPRYYYNKESGQCERFIYGGCKGNDNNFKTVEECQFTCGDY